MRVLWKLAEWPLALALWAYSWVVLATARVSGFPAKTERSTIFINWHRHLPLLVPLHGRARRFMMMSASPYMAPIARWSRLFGLQLVRGASGQGGRNALGALAERLRAGESVVLAVDGPAGPAFVVKPGCVDLALETGAPIVGLAYRGRPQFHTPGRWDRQLLVWPFSRVEILATEPVSGLPGESRDAFLARVQAAMQPFEN